MGAIEIIGTVLVVGFAAVGVVTMGLLASSGFKSTQSDVADLVRIRRETAQAAWSINQRASAALGAMLESSRRDRDSNRHDNGSDDGFGNADTFWAGRGE